VRQVRLTLPSPHPQQAKLLNAFEEVPGVRFVVGACGTKFGKTYGCSIRLVKEAWEKPNTLNWWVAPTFDQSVIALNLVKNLLPDNLYKEYKADRRLEILNPDGSVRSEIQFKSGDRPESLRGYKVHFFIIDEAAIMPYESYVSVLTTVTQTGGHGIIISTPKGRTWFHDVYQHGEKHFADGTPKFKQPHQVDCIGEGCDCPDADPWREWLSIRMPTWTNPYVPEKSIIQARKNLPEDVFQQEYGAQFLSESAGVFRGIKNCLRGSVEMYNSMCNYVIGVDLARIRDYTVLTVMRRDNRHVVCVERFNKISWELQYSRIKSLCEEYGHALCVVDSTGIGDPIVETLRGGGVPVEPYKIGGNIAKQQLIEKLRVNIEKGRISFPECPMTAPLVHELRKYEYKMSETGIIRYEAPDNEHDDCVISLALANWVADQEPYMYKFKHRRA
jgi:hypothetical protein